MARLRSLKGSFDYLGPAIEVTLLLAADIAASLWIYRYSWMLREPGWWFFTTPLVKSYDDVSHNYWLTVVSLVFSFGIFGLYRLEKLTAWKLCFFTLVASSVQTLFLAEYQTLTLGPSEFPRSVFVVFGLLILPVTLGYRFPLWLGIFLLRRVKTLRRSSEQVVDQNFLRNTVTTCRALIDEIAITQSLIKSWSDASSKLSFLSTDLSHKQIRLAKEHLRQESTRGAKSLLRSRITLTKEIQHIRHLQRDVAKELKELEGKLLTYDALQKFGLEFDGAEHGEAVRDIAARRREEHSLLSEILDLYSGKRRSEGESRERRHDFRLRISLQIANQWTHAHLKLQLLLLEKFRLPYQIIEYFQADPVAMPIVGFICTLFISGLLLIMRLNFLSEAVADFGYVLLFVGAIGRLYQSVHENPFIQNADHRPAGPDAIPPPPTFISLVLHLNRGKGHVLAYQTAVFDAVDVNGWKHVAAVSRYGQPHSLPVNWNIRSLDSGVLDYEADQMKRLLKRVNLWAFARSTCLFATALSRLLEDAESEKNNRIVFLETFNPLQLFSLALALLWVKRDRLSLWLLLRGGPNWGRLNYRWRAKLFHIPFNCMIPLFQTVLGSDRFLLLTDSDILKSQLSEHYHKDVHVVPIPHTPKGGRNNKVSPADQVICWWPGAPRPDKGLDVIRRFAELRGESARKITLVVGRSASLAADPEGVRVETVDDVLSRGEYERRFFASDLIILPYDPDLYGESTSGIFVESIVAGAIPLVTQKTWMANELKKHNLDDLAFNWDQTLDPSIIIALANSSEIRKRLDNMQLHYKDFHNVRAYAQALETLYETAYRRPTTLKKGLAAGFAKGSFQEHHASKAATP